MKKYIIRLDDACEKMDKLKWDRIELLLDKYNVKPLVGVIPFCEDSAMDSYLFDSFFWDKVHNWIKKNWTIAMHGFNHVYSSTDGGLNPINKRSEFAGLSLSEQKEKIKNGINIFKKHSIEPLVFFAPSHTFDKNTLTALKEESDIRIISDTIANDSYEMDGFTFVPQQSGRVRKLPFKITTFCYHPNTMNDLDFTSLEKFLEKNNKKFIQFPIIKSKRKLNIYDLILKKIYMMMHR